MTQTIQAAWIRFPVLTVVRAAQSYTRVDEFTYRYASGALRPSWASTTTAS